MKVGRIIIGLFLIILGLASSVFIVGIPIFLVGLYLLYKGVTTSAVNPMLVQQQPPPPPQVVYVQAPPPQPTVIREREVTREIVKVPCRYCGNLNDLATDRFCRSCGAPVK